MAKRTNKSYVDYKNDVQWYCKKRKRPIANSTLVASGTIKLYSEFLTEPITPNNLLRYFDEHGLIGLYEEKEVLKKYVEFGCGDEELNLQ